MLKTVLKIVLISLALIVLLIGIGVAYLFFSMNNSSKKAKVDGVEQSLLCDSVPYVTEQPEIYFSGFDEDEIHTLQFQILRNGSFIQDTLIENAFTYISDDASFKCLNIPYEYFLKTDTIVVTTQSRLHYYISGFRHYAYLHYGMFGYLGHSDCRFDKNFVVNNRKSYVLHKEDGWVNPEK